MLLLLVGSTLLVVGSATRGAQAAQRFIPLMQPGDTLPPIALVSATARRFQISDLRGNAVALAFIYTRCQDARMCPLVSAKFARAQHAIGSAPIRLVLLTLDPTYDTPKVLARYGSGFGQDPRYWTLATGSQAAVSELAARLGIATYPSAPGSIIHTEAAAIITPDGHIARIVYGNDWSASELIGWARAALPGSNDLFAGASAWMRAALESCGGGRFALGGTTMLALLGLAIAMVGGAFWLAFRNAWTGGASP